MKSKTRKLMWSAPLVAVLAVVGALAIFVALAPNLAQAHDVPGVPTDLSAMPAQDDPTTPEVEGRTQIKLTWQAPSSEDMGITGYRIDRSKDGHIWMELEANTATPDVLEYTDSVKGSESGTLYFYRVFAVNDSGVGPMSVIDDGTTMPQTKPDPPENVMAEADGATKVVLKWMPPEDDGGKAVTKYRIHIDPPGEAKGFPALTDLDDPKTTTDGIVVGDICEFSANGGYLEYTHAKRMANQEYRYRVYAYNEVGYSAGSAIRNATTEPKEQPGAPMDVLAVQSSGTAVKLYWNWPASNGGATIKNFRVEVTERNGDWPDSTAVATGVQKPLTEDVSKLAFSVEAKGDKDKAAEVAHTHGFDAKAASADVGKTLYYRVFTVTGTGQNELRSRSMGSVSVKLVAVGDLANMGAVTAAPPEARDDKHGNYSKLTLEWTSPDDNPTSYRIDYSKDGIEWKELEADTRLARPGEYTDAGLEPETDRHYRVFGKRGGKFRAAVKSAAGSTGPAIAPDNVRNITATANGADMIEVRWEQPMYNGGASITHYQVQQSPDGIDWGVAKWLEVKRDANSCELEPIGTWIDKSLSAGDTMYYQVYAVNSASRGGEDRKKIPSKTELATTPKDETDPEADHATTAMAARPDAPTGLTAELARDSKLKGAGRQGILVLWNAPDKPAGSPVTGYRIERKVIGEDNDGWVELEASSSDTRTHYTDRDEPVAGEMRYYRVAAINRLANDTEGLSNWSNIVSIPVGTHTHNAAPMAVGTIADMTVMAGQMSTPMDVPTYFSDADMDDTLTYMAMSDMELYATATVDDMGMVTITGVAAGMATITVTATDPDGASATQTIMVTVEAALMLTAPTGVMATSDADGMVTVSWTPGDDAIGHLVLLFKSDFSGTPMDGTPSSGNSHTFSDVPAGSYIAVVVSYRSASEYMHDALDSVVTVQ